MQQIRIQTGEAYQRKAPLKDEFAFRGDLYCIIWRSYVCTSHGVPRVVLVWSLLRLHLYSLFRYQGCGRSPGDDSQEVVPAANDVPCMPLNQVPEGDGHGFLNCAGVVHMARNVEELRA